MKWWSNVMLMDTETNRQIGECWIVEVEADSEPEAQRHIRTTAWESVDTRLNDVRIDVLDGPTPIEEEDNEDYDDWKDKPWEN